MKKSLLFASVLLMGALSSCNNESEMKVTDPNAMQPVSLKMGGATYSVRGTGMVGGVDDGVSTNNWAGEDLYMMMLKRVDADAVDADDQPIGQTDQWEYSAWDKVEDVGLESETTTPVENFPNIKVKAPDGTNDGAITWTDAASQDKYYPRDGSLHDFFAYRIDDAARTSTDYGTIDLNTQAPEIVNFPTGGTQRVTEKRTYFEIDGTQDLMVGKANIKDVTTDHQSYAFSAKSARNLVVPNITMEHLLTRLAFKVQPSSNVSNFTVEKIQVQSPTKGYMVVAYRDVDATGAEPDMKPTDMIVFPAEANEGADGTTELPWLTVKKNAVDKNNQMEDQEAVTLVFETPQDFGSGIMVAPGKTVYPIQVYVKQTLTSGDAVTSIISGNIKLPQAEGVDVPLKAGSSYTVTITVNGLQEIDVNATLTAWGNGQPIDINPEDELYGGTTEEDGQGA